MNKKGLNPLNKNIKELRQKRDISGDELGKKIGVTRQTIYRYESGEISVPYEKIQLIADALHVNVNVLMGFDDIDLSDDTAELSASLAFDSKAREMLKLFNQLPEDRKDDVINVARMFIKS